VSLGIRAIESCKRLLVWANTTFRGRESAMIKVLQERRVRKNNHAKLIAHLNDLRAAALRQPGYVTGETLVKGDDPIDVLVVSTWLSQDHWNAWTTLEERIALNDIINGVIEGEARISVYEVPNSED
jgi:heme-degrading monooxygenase HmoA